MFLKLEKSFPYFKFRPNIFEPLTIRPPEQSIESMGATGLEVSLPVQRFQDLIRIDYQIGQAIAEAKISIREYISFIENGCSGNEEGWFSIQNALKSRLSKLFQNIEKLEFQNMQIDLTSLFEGEHGLYAIYGYLWSFDLIQLVRKFQILFKEKEFHPHIEFYERSASVYTRVINEVVYSLSKILIKDFQKEMYLIPENWGAKLAKNLKLSEDIAQLFQKRNSRQTVNQLLKLWTRKKCSQNMASFKQIFTALAVAQIEFNFCDYLIYIKTVLLDKVTGAFSGDYETWEIVYSVCLKAYARKQAGKAMKELEIDQIVESNGQDAEFTNFIKKCDVSQVSLSSMNFYLKNCSEKTKAELRPIILKKINCIFKSNGLKQSEDIIEFLESEAKSADERSTILNLFSVKLQQSLANDLSSSEFNELQEGFTSLLPYLIKKEEAFRSVFPSQLFSKIADLLEENKLPQNVINFIERLINIVFIQFFQQEFDLSNIIEQSPFFFFSIERIFSSLANLHHRIPHEVCIEYWSKYRGENEDLDKFKPNRLWESAQLLLISGRQLGAKNEHSLNNEQDDENYEHYSEHIGKIFKKLSDALFEERKQLEWYLTSMDKQKQKQSHQQLINYAQSYLIVKGFKDRILHENILNLALRIHPAISIAETIKIAAQFLTVTSPISIEESLNEIDPFSIYDTITSEEPIECMKLIYKQITDISSNTLDLAYLGNNKSFLQYFMGHSSKKSADLARCLTGCWKIQLEEPITIFTVDQVEEVRKFYFFVELMINVFSKLNEKSQKGIKQIKLIYSRAQSILMEIWSKSILNIIHIELSLYNEESKSIATLSKLDNGSALNGGFFPYIVEKYSKSLKLPYFEEFLTNKIWSKKIAFEFIHDIGEIVNPVQQKVNLQEMFNPLKTLFMTKSSLSAKSDQQLSDSLIYGVGQLMFLIENSCANSQCLQFSEFQSADEKKKWTLEWKKKCIETTSALLELFNEIERRELSSILHENVWTSVFLLHLKVQIIKILNPFIIKQAIFTVTPIDNISKIMEETFLIFQNICEIIEKIKPSEQEHLLSFLELFQNLNIDDKEEGKRKIMKEFLLKAIETLLKLVMVKNIRVRSYHLYKFIRSYGRYSNTNEEEYQFFSSVIAFYMKKLIADYVPDYQLPKEVTKYCDKLMNSEFSSFSSICTPLNKSKFDKLTKMEPKFVTNGEKVCVISMLTNLFCRLNYKCLTKGIEQIWGNSSQYIRYYIKYLQKITPLLKQQLPEGILTSYNQNTVSKMPKMISKTTCDILNLDCYGNLTLILRNVLTTRSEPNTDNKQILIEVLKLVNMGLQNRNVAMNIKNCLCLPIKKLNEMIVSQFAYHENGLGDFITQKISELLDIGGTSKDQENPLQKIEEFRNQQVLDLITLCYSIKMNRSIKSNLDINNIIFIGRDLSADSKCRLIEINSDILGRKISKLERKKLAQKIEKSGGCEIEECWINISQEGEDLIKKIIYNFVASFTGYYSSGVEESKTISTDAQTQFLYFKILSTVVYNNPEVVSYLLDYQVPASMNTTTTVYELMLSTIMEQSMVMFAELYMLIIKTNCGLQLNSKENKPQWVPCNYLIHNNIKLQLLNRIMSKNSNQVYTSLKALNLILRYENESELFRFYKFAKISHSSFEAYSNRMSKKLNEKILISLKNLLSSYEISESKSCNASQEYMLMFMLHNQVFKMLVTGQEIQYLRFNLDVHLSKWDESTDHPLQTTPELHFQPEPLSALPIIKSKTVDTEKQTFRSFRYQVKYDIISPSLCSISQQLGEPLTIKEFSLSFMMNSYNRNKEQLGVLSNINDPAYGYHQAEDSNLGTLQSMEVEESNLISDNGMIIENDEIIQPQQDCILEQDYIIEQNSESNIIRLNCPNDGTLEQSFNILSDCMSNTSINFLEQHSNKNIDAMEQKNESARQDSESHEVNKQHLLHLYEESTINPEAQKQLLAAIKVASNEQLEKFMKIECGVDEELAIVLIRQLRERGRLEDSLTSQILKLGKNPAKISMFIDEAVMYKKMYQNYSTSEANSQIISQYIPFVASSTIKQLILLTSTSALSLAISQKTMVSAINNLMLCPANAVNFIKVCLGWLDMTSEQFERDVKLGFEFKYWANLQQSNEYSQVSVHPTCDDVKRCIVNTLFSSWVQNRLALPLILNAHWGIVEERETKVRRVSLSTSHVANFQPILSYLLKQNTLIEQLLKNQYQISELLAAIAKHQQMHPELQEDQATIENNNLKTKIQKLNNLLLCSSLSADCDDINSSFVHVLWKYIVKCDEYKFNHKEVSKTVGKSQFPYYVIQETLQIEPNVIGKIIEHLCDMEMTIGMAEANRYRQEQEEGHPITITEEYFLLLAYLDSSVFEKYLKHTIKIMVKAIPEMVSKQQKILTSFKAKWESVLEQEQLNSIYGEENDLFKEEKYWDFKQSKKMANSTRSATTRGADREKEIEYLRKVFVDISTNLLPKFKKMRFNFHCGAEYRDWRLDIQILTEKLISQGSMLGLKKLEEKKRQLEEWKREENNTILREQILPVIEENIQPFLQILPAVENYISDFIQFFECNNRKQRIVIYELCARLYEMLLATELLSMEQKPSFHSMSKLKTEQSLESAKNMRQSKRKSSLRRKTVRLSINPMRPKADTLLQKLGKDCSFLRQYLGKEKQIVELHAKYSNINERMKILWVGPDRLQKQECKTIECRRDHILEDTLQQIDESFIKMPIKIKFKDEIGVDYGGVTRQWITLLVRQFIRPDFGLFQLSANNMTFQPSGDSFVIPNHLNFFKKLGIIVGKAMRHNWLLQINLTKSFLKHLLGATLYVEDLEDIDPETAKSLIWILKNDIGEDGAELGLNFTYDSHRLGRTETVELIPGGADILVTESNKKEYVKKLAYRKMTEQIREQSKAFMVGLESVIPYSTLSLFTYKQISLYLAGMPTINIEEMENYAKYEGFTRQSQEILWFWEIVAKWSQEELANFLFFLTGSYKMPYGGFKEHPIGFKEMLGCKDYLPVAHTCFSVIDLSTFSSKQKMGRLLKKAIKEGKGFSVS